MYVSTQLGGRGGDSIFTCEGNEAFLVGANERLPRGIEDVGREAGGKGELVCWISARMKGGGLQVQRWYVPNATRSPSSDMGMVVNSGCKKTRNTGTSASVRKKFQCTPYSVTCSFIHSPSFISDIIPTLA